MVDGSADRIGGSVAGEYIILFEIVIDSVLRVEENHLFDFAVAAVIHGQGRYSLIYINNKMWRRSVKIINVPSSSQNSGWLSFQ